MPEKGWESTSLLHVLFAEEVEDRLWNRHGVVLADDRDRAVIVRPRALPWS